MIITAIAAMSRNGVIGRDGKIPWNLPRDLRRFQMLTMGKPVIMGRKTFESLPAILKNRKHIVLTSDPVSFAEKCFDKSIFGVCGARTLDIAFEIADNHLGSNEVCIIGGESIYRQTAHLWDNLLLTIVDAMIEGDTRFPIEEVDKHLWHPTIFTETKKDDKNEYNDLFIQASKIKDPKQSYRDAHAHALRQFFRNLIHEFNPDNYYNPFIGRVRGLLDGSDS